MLIKEKCFLLLCRGLEFPGNSGTLKLLFPLVKSKGGKFRIKNQNRIQGSLSGEGRTGGWGQSGAAWPPGSGCHPAALGSPSQQRRARLAVRPASAPVGAGPGFLLLPGSIPPASQRPWLSRGRSRCRQVGSEAAAPPLRLGPESAGLPPAGGVAAAARGPRCGDRPEAGTSLSALGARSTAGRDWPGVRGQRPGSRHSRRPSLAPRCSAGTPGRGPGRLPR